MNRHFSLPPSLFVCRRRPMHLSPSKALPFFLLITSTILMIIIGSWLLVDAFSFGNQKKYLIFLL